MRVQPIRGEMITLGQLIKLLNLVSSGAEVKSFLADAQVMVNDEIEARRGRKLYVGDIVEVAPLGKVKLIADG